MGFGNGFGIGNSVNLSAEETSSLKLAVEGNLSEENITNNLQSFLNETISSTILNNASKLKVYVKAVNQINIKFGQDNPNANCPPAEINISGISQTGGIDLDVENDTINEVKNSITSEVKTNITTAVLSISDIFEKGTDIVNKFPEVMNAGFDGVDEMGGGADAVFVSALGGAGIGNSYNADKTVNSSGDLKMKVGMDSTNNINDENDNQNVIDSAISNDSITKIINDILQENKFSIETNQCVGKVNISDLEQINEASLNIKSTALNSVVNTLTNEIGANIGKIIANIADKADNQKAVAELALATGIGIVGAGGTYRDDTGNVTSQEKTRLPPGVCNENSGNCVTNTAPIEPAGGSGGSGGSRVAAPDSGGANTELSSNTMMYVVGGLAALIIIILIVVMSGKRSTSSYDDYYYNKYLSLLN